MIELESMANQGTLSRPGSWSFPDALELGVPGGGVLTWEESKAHLALWAVTSSPLFLGNDARHGRMQQRLVDLLLNPDMIRVNQQYNADAAFAGGRLWTQPNSRELWAKPLHGGNAAVVLFNRGGFTPPCDIHADEHGYVPSIEAPCDDQPGLPGYWGAQNVSMSFGDLPASWLLVGEDHVGLNSLECDVFDVFATAAQGKSLGRHVGGFGAELPPHGVRFLIISDCVLGAMGYTEFV